MAGDWIKVEKATSRKREVLIIAGELGIHPDHAFGLCFRFWSWCDDNLTDCHARGVTPVLLDQLLGHEGFSQAAITAGWLQARESSLEVPHFDRHLSQGAKNRALAKDRKRESRTKHPSKRDECHESNVTKAGLEKRREEKSNKKYITRAMDRRPLSIEEINRIDELIAAAGFRASHENISMEELDDYARNLNLLMGADTGPEIMAKAKAWKEGTNKTRKPGMEVTAKNMGKHIPAILDFKTANSNTNQKYNEGF